MKNKIEDLEREMFIMRDALHDLDNLKSISENKIDIPYRLYDPLDLLLATGLQKTIEERNYYRAEKIDFYIVDDPIKRAYYYSDKSMVMNKKAYMKTIEAVIAIATFDALVICPWALTAICGTWLAVPYVAALTPVLATLKVVFVRFNPVPAE